MDNILEQVEEAVFSLVGTIYPYLNQDSGVAEQITEYAEICRTLNEYVNKHKISFLRIYVPDSKIYKDQISNSYSFYSLNEREEALQELKRGGISWQGTHQIRLSRSGSEHEVMTSAVAVKRLTNYDELAGILCADVKTEEFTSILQEGSSSNEHREFWMHSRKLRRDLLSEAVRREADHPQNRIIRMRHKKTGTVISAKAEPRSARLKRNEPVFLYVRRRFI